MLISAQVQLIIPMTDKLYISHYLDCTYCQQTLCLQAVEHTGFSTVAFCQRLLPKIVTHLTDMLAGVMMVNLASDRRHIASTSVCAESCANAAASVPTP